MKNRLVLFPIIVVIVFVVSMCASATDGFCDETDLEIKPESITHRQYAGDAVTDGYGIEILTEEGYEQAEAIAAMREKQSEITKAVLFSETQHEKTDEVAIKAEELGLFNSEYAAIDTQESASSDSYNLILIILMLFAATSAGVTLAIAWQKRKGVNKL